MLYRAQHEDGSIRAAETYIYIYILLNAVPSGRDKDHQSQPCFKVHCRLALLRHVAAYIKKPITKRIRHTK